MKKLLPLGLLLLTGSVFAQAATKESKNNNPFAQEADKPGKVDLVEKYMVKIDSSDLRKHLEVLASDQYEGRETGKRGQQLAAQYIQQSFKEDGCSYVPGMMEFQQYFEVIETTPGGTVTFGQKALAFKTDFVYMSAKRKVDLSQLPVYTLATTPAEPSADFALIHPLKGMDIRAELDEIRKNQSKNTKAIILVTTNYKDLYEYLEHNVITKTMRLKDAAAKEEVPVILVRAEALAGTMSKRYAYLLGKGKEKKAKKGKQLALLTVSLNTEEQVLKTSNVLAYIPGSDPILAKEVVVLTAHYDHIGIDEKGVVYNGADDDGTGTVALLEIAEAFMAAKRDGNAPRRSIVIMTVSGEEKGLLGSSYYVNHPIVPLEKTIADLNIDMIGRNDIAHEKESDYVYIIGSNMLSTDLHNTNEKANERYTQLNLDYKFNSKDDPNQFYYRSDHYNFAKNNIPSIFYFSGIHEDYHQPTDDIEKINFTKVEKVARLVFSTAWLLANGNQRPALDY
ncbi:MAG TPA: M28 family peptidase [Fluviicola sp.]|nr:M28 family peptidase [Fluviicola sp.]